MGNYLITGAAGGMGSALCRALTGEGTGCGAWTGLRALRRRAGP